MSINGNYMYIVHIYMDIVNVLRFATKFPSIIIGFSFDRRLRQRYRIYITRFFLPLGGWMLLRYVATYFIPDLYGFDYVALVLLVDVVGFFGWQPFQCGTLLSISLAKNHIHTLKNRFYSILSLHSPWRLRMRLFNRACINICVHTLLCHHLDLLIHIEFSWTFYRVIDLWICVWFFAQQHRWTCV